MILLFSSPRIRLYSDLTTAFVCFSSLIILLFVNEKRPPTRHPILVFRNTFVCDYFKFSITFLRFLSFLSYELNLTLI